MLTKDRAVADDLAQSTCERALVQADKFEPGTHLDRWSFTIARRLWLNDIRASAVRKGQGIVPVEQVDLAEDAPGAEVNILAREVLDMIEALPEGQRLASLLVFVEGYTYQEAADFLEVPIGTIMSRVSTARKTLAIQMQNVKEGQ